MNPDLSENLTTSSKVSRHRAKVFFDTYLDSDRMIKKADRLMAEAINIVAGLYKDGILKKLGHYTYAYPDFLYFYQTGGSHIEQVLFKMYMKHRRGPIRGSFMPTLIMYTGMDGRQ